MIARNIKFLSIILVACTLVGCVRYIDSRKDLVEQFGDFDPAEQRVGVTGFYRYEQEQRKRLETLINDRDLDAIKNPTSLYQIGAGDEVNLTVKNFVEVSKNYTVRPDGSIRLPFVGKVTLAGLTETEAIEFIESLVTDYVVDPQVDLQVTSYSANVVWLMNSNNVNANMSERKIQSAYPIKSNNYSLVDLLLEVGDSNLFNSGVIHFYPAPSGSQNIKANKDLIERFNSFAVSDWVGKTFENEDCDGREFTPEGTKFRVKACYPYENNVTQEELLAKYDPNARIEIDTEEVFGGATRAPLRLILKPGDIIYIPPPATIQIFGEVNGRGTYQVIASNQGGMGGSGGGGGGIKPTLLSALSAARGLTYSADINNMYIYREIHFANKSILNVDLEKIVLWAGQDVRLRDGDIIYVPSKSGRYSQEQSVNLINQLTGSITNVDRAVDLNQ